ncbi:TRAP transporter permease [Thalassospira sp.]|uniref:TRAP transporter permease n=1 Tax=Thalassospira sp. TaxID=1912094 RepID=UPI003AA9B591
MKFTQIYNAMVEAPSAIGGAERNLSKKAAIILSALCFAYSLGHVVSLNLYPIETWTFRILHVVIGVCLGFILVRGRNNVVLAKPGPFTRILRGASLAGAAISLALYCIDPFYPQIVTMQDFVAVRGLILIASTFGGLVSGWIATEEDRKLPLGDLALALSGLSVGFYALTYVSALQFRAGVLPTVDDITISFVAVLVILEITRRMTGNALVIIAVIFLTYSLMGQYLPGAMGHSGYSFGRIISYLLTDNGILGTTVSVSSTYLVLFIVFAAFLQITGVGDYFVQLSFSIAGRARGGPAKVAVLASALMGMINGSSAGNVVATGSFTIPLMKKVGYPPKSAAAVEAAASTGGQIMPPIMGAGAFIMAELTGIPYTELMVAAILPAVLYFTSVYFMVDFEAAKQGMKGLPSSELPKFSALARHLFLLLPVAVLIISMFLGYSVIRSGTWSCVAAAVLSFFGPQPLTLPSAFRGFRDATRMLLQLIVVCSCAGIIVGIIGLTGIGLKFSALLLQIAEHNQLVALMAAMFVTILMGMGMPTTAAYAIAASVIAPGLIKLGIPVLTAHLFVFYYAVVSAITPPVALAGFAAAGVAGTDPMQTSIRSFAVGFAAFLVPILFYVNGALLLQGDTLDIILAFAEGMGIVILLAGALQGWLFKPLSGVARAVLLVCIGLLSAAQWPLAIAAVILMALLFAASIVMARKRPEPLNPTAPVNRVD